MSPYIDDLVLLMGLKDHADDVPSITPGQPFRLKLWKHLALAMHDPDAEFLDTLEAGAPLGVNQPLQPSPAWPPTLIAFRSQFLCRTARLHGRAPGTIILWFKNWSKMRSSLGLLHTFLGAFRSSSPSSNALQWVNLGW